MASLLVNGAPMRDFLSGGTRASWARGCSRISPGRTPYAKQYPLPFPDCLKTIYDNNDNSVARHHSRTHAHNRASQVGTNRQPPAFVRPVTIGSLPPSHIPFLPQRLRQNVLTAFFLKRKRTSAPRPKRKQQANISARVKKLNSTTANTRSSRAPSPSPLPSLLPSPSPSSSLSFCACSIPSGSLYVRSTEHVGCMHAYACIRFYSVRLISFPGCSIQCMTQ
ncbi:hypothetical protein BDW74DRAFT_25968 [Aspergillus multicolor]|uniref:uncharacterized protein n=1 Tax=Aspergillus multicolor TaxID=41759 RepID=UPI003CCE4DC2